MAVATIELTKEVVKTTKGAVKLTITAAGSNIEAAVFAIEVLPRSNDSLDPIYRFSHICSPAELVEFPDYEPEDECYFRTDTITMVFDTATLAEMTWESIQKDVNALVKEYNQLFALENAGGVISDSLLYTEINTHTEP